MDSTSHNWHLAPFSNCRVRRTDATHSYTVPFRPSQEQNTHIASYCFKLRPASDESDAYKGSIIQTSLTSATLPLSYHPQGVSVMLYSYAAPTWCAAFAETPGVNPRVVPAILRLMMHRKQRRLS